MEQHMNIRCPEHPVTRYSCRPGAKLSLTNHTKTNDNTEYDSPTHYSVIMQCWN